MSIVHSNPELKNLDFNALLRLVDGEEALGREVMQTMVDELADENEELPKIVARQDWKLLNYLTDRLSGSAAWCGMDKIKYISNLLSSAASRQDLTQIHLQLGELQHAIADALTDAADLKIIPRNAAHIRK
jgi:hypothetical protein